MKQVVRRVNPNLPISPCNGQESMLIQFLTATADQCDLLEPKIERRLRTIPHGWRDWKLMRSIMRRVCDMLLDTMPDKEILRLNKMLQHGEIFVRFRPPIRDTQYQLVENETIRRLVNQLIADECAICFKEGAQIKRCGLRRDLHEIVPSDVDYDPCVECIYRNAAVRGKPGEYI